jgi:hypothetical protein
VIDKSAFDIVGEYYAQPSFGSEFMPGRVCDATVYYLPAGNLRVLKFDIEAANRGERISYDIGSVEAATFRHKPVVRPYPLEYNEAFVVAKAKRRPVVILSSPIVRPAVVGLPKQDFPDVYLVCPLYSFGDNHPLEFRLRLEAWEYSMLFHLPGSDEFGVCEGFLRFDRSIIIPQGQLRPRSVALTESALYALQHCFSWFLTGKLDSDFAEYRQKLLDALNRALQQP